MKRVFCVLAALAITSVSAWAIDGQVLINQSTVVSAGGFPYIISQPGSYKLSGNLTGFGNCGYVMGFPNPQLTTCAIWIQTTNVVLDLNGFTVTGDTSSGGAIGWGSPTQGGVGLYAKAYGTIRNGQVVAVTPIASPTQSLNGDVLENLSLETTGVAGSNGLGLGGYNRLVNVTAPGIPLNPGTPGCTNVIQNTNFYYSLASSYGPCSSWTGNY